MSSSLYVELVNRLRALSRETEWLEFKRDRCTPAQLGECLSALANSACLMGEPFGYLLFGIDDRSHDVVGTDFDPYRAKGKGNQDLLHWLATGLRPSTELNQSVVHHPAGRVVVFRVDPAADQPVRFYGKAFVRIGASKTSLDGHPTKERGIWTNRLDWTEEPCERASLDDLDPAAIRMVRERFLSKYAERADEVRQWDDRTLLNKAEILQQGAVTNAAVILLGRPEASTLVSPKLAQIAWALRDHLNDSLDHDHIYPPFVFAGDRLLKRIRNLTVRVLPRGTTIPRKVSQYDAWVIREALHNCIAHQDYFLCGQIVIVERPHHISLSNMGEFRPRTIETVIRENAPRRRNRNPFLVSAMAELGLADKEGGGIKRMFDRQRKRGFPMPDYYFSEPDAVTVQIPGRITDEEYSDFLVTHPELDLESVMLVDHLQKGKDIGPEGHQHLAAAGLEEGRYPNLLPLRMAAHAVPEVKPGDRKPQ